MRSLPLLLAGALAAPVAARAAEAPAAAWQSIEVPGGTAGLLQAAGLHPGLPRWQAVDEVTRRLHATYGDAAPARRGMAGVRAYVENGGSSVGTASLPAAGPRADDESAGVTFGGLQGFGSTVPLPLAPSAWSAAVFRRGVPDNALLGAILFDRGASLLYRGLARVDPETLAFLSRDPDTLREVYRQGADVFSVFGRSFAVRGGRVDVPGGPEARSLWEDLLGEKVDKPGRFVRRLLKRQGGRTAFFYDAVSLLDPAHQRFALGLGQSDPDRRRERFRALASAFAGEEAWWRPQGGSFTRPADDPGTVLTAVRVDRDGAMAPPSGRAFWEAAFSDGVPGDGAALARGETVDAAWLAGQVGHGPPEQRRERLCKLAFAQRVFGAIPEEALPDALWALRGVSRTPALVFALERMGLTSPRVLAAAVRQAEHMPSGGHHEGALALAQLQGGLAIVERSRLRRTLDGPAAAALLESLLAVPLEDGHYHGGIARWLADQALPVLRKAAYGPVPPGSDEEAVTRAMSGAVLGAAEPRVFEWEGLYYRAEVGEGERRRLEQVRRRQGGNALDAVLAFAAAVEPLGQAAGREAIGAGLSNLQAAARPLEPARYAGTEALDVRALVAAVKKDEAGATRLSGGSRARLGEAAERLLADVLLSFAYAPHLGSPEGSALAGANVAFRHFFGNEPWAVPLEAPEPGVPWRVEGSLVGLDVALATLSLRRLSADMPLHPPGVDAATRLGFARQAVLMDPRALEDRDQAAIAEAIERGRARVQRLAGAGEAAAEAARDAGLDAWRARSLDWVIANEPAALPRFFSLHELFRLGRPEEGGFDDWGGTTLGEDGGWRLRLPGPRPFDGIAGERLEDLLPSRFADLGLRAAVDLHARGLPAALAPGLLAYYVEDMADDAEPRADDDWLALVRFVQEIAPDRVDDVVSAQAGGGALLPAPEPGERR